MKKITFYHSMLCPRCHVSGMFLSKLEQEFPDVTVERVEYLTNLGRAKEDGVWSIPTLVSGDRKLSGILLGSTSMRAFLESVSTTSEQGLQGAR